MFLCSLWIVELKLCCTFVLSKLGWVMFCFLGFEKFFLEFFLFLFLLNFQSSQTELVVKFLLI